MRNNKWINEKGTINSTVMNHNKFAHEKVILMK